MDPATSQDAAAVLGIFGLFSIALTLVTLAGLWKIFTKAGKPGWGALIPIYNAYLVLKIAGRPGIWLLLLLIPVVNGIIGIILYLDLAKSFGKGIGFALGMLFLPVVFLPVLGFGSARYQGAGA